MIKPMDVVLLLCVLITRSDAHFSLLTNCSSQSAVPRIGREYFQLRNSEESLHQKFRVQLT